MRGRDSTERATSPASLPFMPTRASRPRAVQRFKPRPAQCTPEVPENCEAQDLTLSPRAAPPTQVDLERSRKLAKFVRAANGYCYVNSLRALPIELGAVYEEGWVVTGHGSLLVLEHGWIRRPDGVVIDPTPCYCAPGVPSHTYFPAFRWTHAEFTKLFRAHLRRSGAIKTPLNLHLPYRGRRSAGWRDATLAAYRHANARSHERWGRPYLSSEEEVLALSALLGHWWTSPDLRPRDGECRDESREEGREAAEADTRHGRRGGL